LSISLHEIRRLTDIDLDKICTIAFVEDSLEPEIPVNPRAVYVFAIDDTLLIKKIRRYAGGALEIIPINETYSRELLVPVKDVDQPNLYRSKQSGLVATFRVVGRVVL
jgi:hypothetical protein